MVWQGAQYIWKIGCASAAYVTVAAPLLLDDELDELDELEEDDELATDDDELATDDVAVAEDDAAFAENDDMLPPAPLVPRLPPLPPEPELGGSITTLPPHAAHASSAEGRHTLPSP